MFIALSLLFFLGCQPVKTQSNVSFEVKNFELKYEESKLFSTSESYTGKGTIIATGDPAEIKKPYLVLLKITRISGGSETDTKTEQTDFSLVENGLGTFTTFDIRSANKKFEKPEYKIEVIGYIPFILQKPSQPNKG
jgi:hypothetical protein